MNIFDRVSYYDRKRANSKKGFNVQAEFEGCRAIREKYGMNTEAANLVIETEYAGAKSLQEKMHHYVHDAGGSVVTIPANLAKIGNCSTLAAAITQIIGGIHKEIVVVSTDSLLIYPILQSHPDKSIVIVTFPELICGTWMTSPIIKLAPRIRVVNGDTGEPY